jgi:hypothetical protein
MLREDVGAASTIYATALKRFPEHLSQIVAALSGDDLERWGTVSHYAQSEARKGLVAIVRTRAAERLRSQATVRLQLGKEAEALALLERAKLAESLGAAVSRLGSASFDAISFSRLEIAAPKSLLGNGVLTSGGFFVIYGQPGLGKTWHALTLARSVVRGEPWLGMPTTAARVGFVELEIDDYYLHERAKALGIGSLPQDVGLRFVPRLQLRGGLDLIKPESLAELERFIREYELEMIIIDALARAHSAADESAAELGPLLAGIDGIRRDTGSSIGLVHHERKSSGDAKGGDNDLDALRGTSRLQSDPTLLIRVKSRSGSMRSVNFAKVSTGKTPKPVFYVLDDGGIPVVTDAPEVLKDENRAKVLGFVTAAGVAVSSSEVAGGVGVTDRTALRHLNALVESGELVFSGNARNRRYLVAGIQTSRQTEIDTDGILYIDADSNDLE